MKTIKKLVKQPNFTNKKYMLLGVRKEDKAKVWLEQASFDCGWYIGFGYLEVVNRRWTDINMHYHFKGLNDKENINLFDAFKKEFVCSTLTDKELWILCDLMKSFYTLQDVADLYYTGNSHYTSHSLSLKNENKYLEALKEQKQVIYEVQKLLGLTDEQNTVLNFPQI